MRIPERIANAARERFLGQREGHRTVRKYVEAGSPYRAEPDAARLRRRFEAVAQVDRTIATALVDNGSPAALGLRDERRLGAERIQGRTVDFVGVSFLERARRAASAVGRIVYRSGHSPRGSGFLIGDGLLITNHHVIDSAALAGDLLVEFDYELDLAGNPREVTRFEFAPQTLFVSSGSDLLDYTVVALGRNLSGGGSTEGFGFLPLLSNNDKHTLGEYVNVVQHPQGDFKQVVLRENLLLSRLETVLHYRADTEPGSSGSPVFNDQWQVIALHHWGEPYTETVDADNRPLRGDMNEGVRISAIVEALRSDLRELSAREQELLLPSLDPVSFEAVSSPARVPIQRDASGPTGGSRVTVQPDGTATWNIPLEVSVRLGGGASPAMVQPTQPQAPQPQPRPAASGLSERVRPERPYNNRRGYNPTFLRGPAVALPQLSESQRRHAARISSPEAGDDPIELKYQHFSIVMNAPRRVAFFTATNIDGASWIHIVRATGEPRESAEARENWFPDPRVSAYEQSDDDDYYRQSRHTFDRGHLVRRQDPSWGSDARAIRANADTFHWTNCSPQQSTFNQQSRYWQGIENYILKNAKEEDKKVTVFCGPVFRNDDPEFRDLKVPRQFWKVVVRVEGERLMATALMADQSELLPRRMPERSEGFDDLGRVAQYQTSVRYIERLTGLDFGDLRNRDTSRPREEALEEVREINAFEEIELGSGLVLEAVGVEEFEVRSTQPGELTLAWAQALVAEATGRKQDYTGSTQQLGRLGVVSATGIRKHKQTISKLLKPGYKIDRDDIKSGADIIVADCALSVLDNAKGAT
jgi:endonuclease G, mitochondrial